MDKPYRWLAIFLIAYALLGIGHLFLPKHEKNVPPPEFASTTPSR